LIAAFFLKEEAVRLRSRGRAHWMPVAFWDPTQDEDKFLGCRAIPRKPESIPRAAHRGPL
jgi:hypothetical protein